MQLQWALGALLLIVIILQVGAADALALSPTGAGGSGFTIADDGSSFLLDGKVTRLISGSLHYFRVPHTQWDNRMKLFKAAGLNAVQTYVAWNFHCPDSSTFCDFSGDRNISYFFQLAKENGLHVLLRPGPYICAEWDLGGFPAWILAHNTSIRLRTSDPQYLAYVSAWFDVLLPIVNSWTYSRAAGGPGYGPVAMVQVENEYGAFGSDQQYLTSLVGMMKKHLGSDVVLYSTDPFMGEAVNNSATEGVFQTVDFFSYGLPEKLQNVTRAFEVQGLPASLGRARKGPHMNSEFYPGWVTHWGGSSFLTRSLDYITRVVKEVLVSSNATSNLNFYVFFGGTNFGFWAGQTVTTSYDYDAPIQENGLPREPRYSVLRSLLPTFSRYTARDTSSSSLATSLPLPPSPASYGAVNLTQMIPVYDYRFLEMIGRSVAEHEDAKSMEQLGQSYGYTAYSFNINATVTELHLPQVKDYVMIFFDGQYVGFLLNGHNNTWRWKNSSNTSSAERSGSTKGVHVGTCMLLIDNNGRLNYWGPEASNDLKGLVAKVKVTTTTASSEQVVEVRTITRYLSYTLPMELSDLNKASWNGNGWYRKQVPIAFRGSVVLNSSSANSTYFDMRSWGRGFVMVNGHNLGRYWSVQGPQYSLFCPGDWLHLDGVTPNDVIVYEQFSLPGNMTSIESGEQLHPMKEDPVGGFATIIMSENNYNV